MINTLVEFAGPIRANSTSERGREGESNKYIVNIVTGKERWLKEYAKTMRYVDTKKSNVRYKFTLE